ncbi:hypothetical protein, partial [Photobacterium phosphoreum]|uniref:hypothetical protein n=1 Tax=Photobacterium phosphoreum TaxID=659 RepID=UPI000D49DFBD
MLLFLSIISVTFLVSFPILNIVTNRWEYKLSLLMLLFLLSIFIMSTRSIGLTSSDDLLRYYNDFNLLGNNEWRGVLEQKNYFFYLIDKFIYFISSFIGHFTINIYLIFLVVVITVVKFTYVFRVFPYEYKLLGICWVCFSPLLLTLETQVIKQTLAIYILGLALSFTNKKLRIFFLSISFFTHLGALFVYFCFLTVKYVTNKFKGFTPY